MDSSSAVMLEFTNAERIAAGLNAAGALNIELAFEKPTMRPNVSLFHDVLHLCCVEKSGLCVSTQISIARRIAEHSAR
jgi:hypothetical protein